MTNVCETVVIRGALLAEVVLCLYSQRHSGSGEEFRYVAATVRMGCGHMGRGVWDRLKCGGVLYGRGPT